MGIIDVLFLDGPYQGKIRAINSDLGRTVSLSRTDHVDTRLYRRSDERVAPCRYESIDYQIHEFGHRRVLGTMIFVPYDKFVSYQSDDIPLLKWMGKTVEREFVWEVRWNIASLCDARELRSDVIQFEIERNRLPGIHRFTNLRNLIPEMRLHGFVLPQPLPFDQQRFDWHFPALYEDCAPGMSYQEFQKQLFNAMCEGLNIPKEVVSPPIRGAS